MNEPYIKDIKPNLTTEKCNNIPRIADSVTIKEQKKTAAKLNLTKP